MLVASALDRASVVSAGAVVVWARVLGVLLGVVEAIEASNALVIGSPVFQGSYPGLFKHVFDLVRPQALKHRPVLLTACGGGLRHSLVVEHQLRPLFGFFEACTISTAIYAGAAEFVDGRLESAAVQARIADAVDQLATHLKSRCVEAA